MNAAADVSIDRMGVLCIVLCIALGISHLIHLNLLIIFGIICLYVTSVRLLENITDCAYQAARVSHSYSLKYPCSSAYVRLHLPLTLSSDVSPPTTCVQLSTVL